MMKKITLLFLFLITCSAGLLAQVKIQGKVTDAQGLPMPGVSVSEKGSGKGTATNANGQFSLEVTDGSAIIKFFMLCTNSFFKFVFINIINNKTIKT